MSVIAIVPARANSKGVPGKNLRPLAGLSPMNRAIDVCNQLRGVLQDYYVTSDIDWEACEHVRNEPPAWRYGHWLKRPAELARDDTPMIDVVKHVLSEIPGPPDQIVVLLQPTQPLRTPAHVVAAIERLQTGDWDSVVTITPIPRTHAPDFVLMYCDTTLGVSPWNEKPWDKRPARRQSVPWPYIADGTCYAFYRRTVERYGNIYGEMVSAIVIDPAESCALDTPEDWAEAERRLTKR